jgi:hypothetical protein
MTSVVYLLAGCLLGCLMVLTRHQVSKDAELLMLRHENAVLRLWRACAENLIRPDGSCYSGSAAAG